MIERTPLDPWILGKIGGGKVLNREDLEAYQLEKLQETVDYARQKSPFYYRHLADIREDGIKGLDDLGGLPFTTPDDLRNDPLGFLCVSPGEIARIVTLDTSGTTGAPKRVYFTEADVELTADFFCHGMSTMAKPGAKVLIFLPGDKPNSVGDLLVKGLRRIDVEGLVHGPVRHVKAAVNEIIDSEADCLVGIPTQVLALARSREGDAIEKGMIKSVLLSTDYVPQAIVRELNSRWGCDVFNHYGMTEMGFGGGVDCEGLSGYHLREADLYFEIVDPKTGGPVVDGETGEVVFTTLTRKGMPLIRYRTGDIARFIRGTCPCGTMLKRMAHVQGRWAGRTPLGSHGVLALPEMDEALLHIPWLIDYRAIVTNDNGKDSIEIIVRCASGKEAVLHEVVHALEKIPAVREGLDDGSLLLKPIRIGDQVWHSTGTTKREIIDKRGREAFL